MTEPVNVRPKGSILVGIGGGSAPEQVQVGPDGSYLTANSAMPEGVEWAGNELAAVTGPTTAVDGDIAVFNGATGKIIADSGLNVASNVLTFPADGGTVYTAGTRKGSFTFNGSGTHAKIVTTAAVTGCVIAYTIVTLGTVTAAQAILTTIDTGVGFTPVSADATDSSVVNWAIIA